MNNNNTGGTEPIVPNNPSLPSAEEVLKKSFIKNVTPLVGNMISFEEAGEHNGYKWVYEAMHEYAAPLLEQIRQLQEEVNRLTSTLEDTITTESGNKIAASDSYFEIADMLQVPQGGSAIDAVRELQEENKRLKDDIQDWRDHHDDVAYRGAKEIGRLALENKRLKQQLQSLKGKEGERK